MIVNPSYAYMGKAEPANPVIFDKNVVNYPYSGKNYDRSETSGYFVLYGVSELIFSDLDLTNFTKLSVNGDPGRNKSLPATVVFIDDSGNISKSEFKSYPPGRSTQVWDIPQQFRTKKCKVKLTTNNGTALIFYSATLS